MRSECQRCLRAEVPGGRGHCPFKDMSSCHDVKMNCSHVVMYLYSLYTNYIYLLYVHSFCKIYNFLFQFFPRICKRVSKTFAISYNLLNSSVLNVHSDHSMFVRNCFYCSIWILQYWVYLHILRLFHGNTQGTRSERWNEFKDISINIFILLIYLLFL